MVDSLWAVTQSMVCSSPSFECFSRSSVVAVAGRLVVGRRPQMRRPPLLPQPPIVCSRDAVAIGTGSGLGLRHRVVVECSYLHRAS